MPVIKTIKRSRRTQTKTRTRPSKTRKADEAQMSFSDEGLAAPTKEEQQCSLKKIKNKGEKNV
jgi:hypothetical protein